MNTLQFLPGLGIAAALSLSAAGCQSSGCEEGSFQSEDPKYCLRLPPDYEVATQKPLEVGGSKYVRITNKKNLRGFALWFDKKDLDLEKRAQILKGMESADMKLTASGDVPNRDGKFFHFHNGSGNFDFAVVLVKGKETMYRCEIQNTPPEDAKLMVDACKTLWGP